jgi:hypothetical protein
MKTYPTSKIMSLDASASAFFKAALSDFLNYYFIKTTKLSVKISNMFLSQLSNRRNVAHEEIKHNINEANFRKNPILHA